MKTLKIIHGCHVGLQGASHQSALLSLNAG